MLHWNMVLLTLTTILLAGNAQSATASTQQTANSPVRQFQPTPDTVIDGKRFLRGTSKETNAAVAEERSPNMDLIIKDAASEVKKAVFWKFKFAVWKHLLRRDTHTARQKLGMGNMGREVYWHKNYEQLQAYQEFFKKGPLKYPKGS
ncbi:hypothetical protein PHYSODRAFT_284492 [Phytophthora sojae]|uniref:RxLR effector protein n=2 Tax=Phytophthora sojae TaxID=67593 RepID=G4YE60_PHYSP|nr:hypothetical protein PHYSODRAFT_284492 [Phytophthora sojae]AEK80579.1 Avh59 [Phytophthora sojae]AEK80581.1 Avh59 [Phytophthora sojae]EGZ29641.1 hypothetical protein PHYSODRAFT_284492 [Phytophthora sojae]|eukprot:XP_009516916.1 hypothetical protein PHYSODRAFT_284492 [Phytophthora sojae]